jgi:twitching motility protein PilT
MSRLDSFLRLGREQGCSDIHFAVGAPPLLRLYGEITPVKYRDLSVDELSQFIFEILGDEQKLVFEQEHELDFSYAAEGIGRFRVNLFQKIGGIGATFRVIAPEIPTVESLGLPPIVRRLAHSPHGLVLVTGATGMGKSSTLAAMIDHINQTRRLNIITLEDPIEFVHESKKSLIKQREVGVHVDSFADGIRDALRQDPDVILVGELRDADAISQAMMAAETGHLVLGTLHTSCAAKTLDRFLDGLPPDQRDTGSIFLAQNLRGVVSQALVRRANGREKTAIHEILVMTDAIGNLMLNGNMHQIPANLQTGKNLGMQLMDQALLEAVQSKKIDPDDAYLHALDKRPFQQFVTDPQLVPQVALLAS